LEGHGVRLGVRIEQKDDGVLIMGVMPDSAASKAGLLTGDIVTSFGGEAVKEPFDLIYLIREREQGDKEMIEVLRDSKPMKIEVLFE